jgi:hypothetical protein
MKTSHWSIKGTPSGALTGALLTGGGAAPVATLLGLGLGLGLRGLRVKGVRVGITVGIR